MDGVHGDELWKTDGTDAGTAMVSDINVGASGSKPNNFTYFNNNMFFWANDSVHGRELWSLDLTATGIAEVPGNSNHSYIYPNPFSNEVNITWPQATSGQLLVYNNLGQLLLQQPVLNAQNAQLNTQDLPQGLYILMLRSSTNTTTLGKNCKRIILPEKIAYSPGSL